MVKAELNDVRDKLAELLNYHSVKDELQVSVDKVNGDEDFPDASEAYKNAEILSRMDKKVEDFEEEISKHPDKLYVNDDQPIDKILKSKQKIILLQPNLSTEKVKMRSDAICPVCSSNLGEHDILSDMVSLIDDKIEKGGVMLNES